VQRPSSWQCTVHFQDIAIATYFDWTFAEGVDVGTEDGKVIEPLAS